MITVSDENNTYTPIFEPIYVTYDSIFSFRRWADSGIHSGHAMTINSVDTTGFSATSTNASDSYSAESRPVIPVIAGKEYTFECDVEGSAFEIFVFYCNENGVWTDRGEHTGAKTSKKFNFTPTRNYITIRCDIVGTNTARFSNFRIYPSNRPYMSNSVTQDKRTNKANDIWGSFIPRREHYNFNGWTTNEDGTGTKYTNSDVHPLENLILYSQWTPVNYTISASVKEGNGSVSGGGTYPYGKTDVRLTATPSTGYYFAGWSDGNTSNPRVVTVNNNATYEAIFKKLIYTVTTSVS
jgi:uncharacterized repeat protein (TIGR02543 family)